MKIVNEFQRKDDPIEIHFEDNFTNNAPHHFVCKLRDSAEEGKELGRIDFQEGPIKIQGENGIQNEHLLLMVRERLKNFQCSQFACRENALALTHIEEALSWLNARTRQRELRGVEGTYSCK